MARFGRSRPRAVLPLADLAASAGRRDTQMGALARGLSTLERFGVAIPETWVVVADVFRHVVHTQLPPGHDPASLLRTSQRPVGVERAARAQERLLDLVLENDLEREIDAAWRAVGEAAPWGIAVRASAVVGDQGVARAAGLSCTELPVFERDELGAAIRRAWARAVSESTLAYLRGRRVRDLAIAVVLQPVVPAHASVTLLTDARTVLSPDVLGTGAHQSRPHRLAIAVGGLRLERTDLAAAEVVLFDPDGVVKARRAPASSDWLVVRAGKLVAAPDAGSTGAFLDDARIAELTQIAWRLDSMGSVVVRAVVPREGDISGVDVHPSQHLGYPGTGTAQTLWSRVAVTEAPAAPLSPLSRHVLSGPVLERARRAFGERAPRSGKLSGVLTALDGRAYLNVSPVLEGDDGQDTMTPIARLELASAQWTPELARERAFPPSLARAGLRIAQLSTEQRALTDDVSRFERDAEQQRRWLSEMDLAILPDDALTTTLHEVSDFLARAQDLTVRSSAAALAGHALLASVLTGVDAAHASWLAHSVTAGADVVTARPAAAFCHVAAIARFDAPARAVLEGVAPRHSDLPDGPLRRALLHFLGAYGDRGLSEAELGAPRWGEEPSPVLAMLASSLRADAVDPDVALSRARALADRQLALLEPRLSFFETRVVRDIVSRQRELLRLRERCRARLAHGLAMMRVVALDVDRRVRRLDPALEAGAALLLTLDELGVALSKYRADLAPIVRARRSELRAQQSVREPPPVFRGVVGEECPTRFELVVRGLPASAGVGEGKVVRVGGALEGLERFSPGDVLVVRSLDLGLAPLFLQARAVVAELGTPFSSSSVVARDCGVPVVAGVAGVWSRFRDGERVHVDGDAGTVEPVGT
jgi:rifampicin phosphotransferase